ncbi:MAG: murein L,D-transpeptidase catalytic domain family protein [Bacteroidota bacterium]|nr:murein L,D-transpeptidase catalytic domain family protein [Bacteroidota bacterium]
MPGIVKRAGKFILIGFIFTSIQSFAGDPNKGVPGEKNFPSLFSNSANSPVLKKTADSIYDLISLGEYGLERDVFFNAYKGYEYLETRGMLKKSNLLTICDYSQSSNNKRLYVIDLVNSRLLFNTFVSHGRNSGNEFATSFSNYDNSNKSSLGFMLTGDTYHGKAGFCMRFNGVEAGINDRVKSRGIVLHGSRFVNENIMSEKGTIGKSLGCPAVPFGIHTRIIDAIKGGSCFFINSPDQWYVHNSNILNAQFDLAPALQLANTTSNANADNGFLSTATVK